MSSIPSLEYSGVDRSKTGEPVSSACTQPAQFQPVDTKPQQPEPIQFKPGGQPQPYYVVQPQCTVQPVGQQPYMVQPYQPGGAMMIGTPLLPRELQPNDFFVVTLIVAVVCAVFNVTSLFFSVPAIICSLKAIKRRNVGKYVAAKQFGSAVIILDFLSITWVMVWGVIVVGISFACINIVGGFCN